MPTITPTETTHCSAVGEALSDLPRGRLLRVVLLALGLGLGAAAIASWVLRMDVGVSGRGQVVPAQRSHAKARSAGLVRAVLVRQGQQVQAGSVVAQLEDAVWQAELVRLQHDLEANRARQVGLQQTALQRRTAAAAQVEGAYLAVEQARLQLEALQLEYDQPAGPVLARLGWQRRPFAELVPVRQQQAVVLQRQAALRQAEDEVQAAEQALADLRVLQEEYRKLQDERRQLQCSLGQTTVLAPISGTVLTPHPEELVGDHVADGDAVVEIARLDDWVAEVALAEGDVHRVRPGQRARISVAAFPHAQYRLFDGQVTQVSPAPLAAGYPVRLRIADAHVREGRRLVSLACGMTAEARIVVDRQRIAVLIWRQLLGTLWDAQRRGVGLSEDGA